MTAIAVKPTHPWLRRIRVAYEPGPIDALLDAMMPELLESFSRLGHEVPEIPDDGTDVVFTTAPFGRPLDWREAAIFRVRRKYGLTRQPTIFTVVHATREEFDRMHAHFDRVLEKEPPQAEDYDFPGLSPTALHVLIEQGRRGGPILALQRVVQAQAKSIRVLLVVGNGQPEDIYHFDLVGAYPTSDGTNLEEMLEDTVSRVVTTMSTKEVTAHEVLGEPVPQDVWRGLTTPQAMTTAGQELGRRAFFTEMVRIADLVQVPAVTEGVASQYSEGCFGTWDPRIGALIATVTGSARPVDKGDITDEDLAVIVGVREDGAGAKVRHVEGKRNDPPSSEAVEMMDINNVLPEIELEGTRVPVVRSILHGHRGVAAFDEKVVEFVPLDEPFYHYLVSCATEAQARGIKRAFSRSEALLNPEDPRVIAFTVLPGHGCVIAEKWVPGRVPFETIWASMDTGALEIEAGVPQGPMSYRREDDGKMRLQEASAHERVAVSAR